MILFVAESYNKHRVAQEDRNENEMWEGPVSSSFLLSNKDIKGLSSTCKHLYEFFKKTLAAIIIKNAFMKFLKFKRHNEWINYCIKCAINSHGCPWRLSLYGLPRLSGFATGALDWQKWENEVDFYTLRGRILWCKCGHPVDACTYRSVGEKMRCSYPILTFECYRCLMSYDFYFWCENYQEPITCSFHEFIEETDKDDNYNSTKWAFMWCTPLWCSPGGSKNVWKPPVKRAFFV